MALGAQAGDVLRPVTGHGLRLIGLGLLLGFAGAYFLMKLFAGALHGVSAHDPWSFAIVGALLLAVGLVASLSPGARGYAFGPPGGASHE